MDNKQKKEEQYYAITEQGDLGLGLTPIDESVKIKNSRQQNQSSDDKETDCDLY